MGGPVASDVGFDWSSLRFDRSTFGVSDPDVSATLEKRVAGRFYMPALDRFDCKCVWKLNPTYPNLASPTTYRLNKLEKYRWNAN